MPAHLDALVARVVEAQESAGLEPVTDGRLRWQGFVGPMAALDGLRIAGDAAATAIALPAWSRPLTVDAWRFAARATGRVVMQALPGPYTLGRRMAGPDGGGRSPRRGPGHGGDPGW